MAQTQGDAGAKRPRPPVFVVRFIFPLRGNIVAMSQLAPSPSFARTFTRIFVPVAFQNLFFSLIGILDVLMVGQLGDAPVAAVGLAGQFYFLLTLTLFGTASGASVFAAQYWGARDLPNLRRVLGLCLSVCLGVAVIFAFGALVFPRWVMGLYTQDPAVVGLGVSYLQIIGWSYVFTAITVTIAAMVRSTGNTRLPMLVAVSTLTLDMALEYCLIFGKLGLPALGVRGSALGTAISRGVECLALVLTANGRPLPVAMAPRQLFGFNLAFVSHHLRLILLVFLNEFLWVLGVNGYSAMMAHLGTSAYAAYNISSTFLGVGLFVAMGCTTTCSILVGHHIGAGQPEAAYRTASRALVISVLGSILVRAGPGRCPPAPDGPLPGVRRGPARRFGHAAGHWRHARLAEPGRNLDCGHSAQRRRHPLCGGSGCGWHLVRRHSCRGAGGVCLPPAGGLGPGRHVGREYSPKTPWLSGVSGRAGGSRSLAQPAAGAAEPLPG